MTKGETVFGSRVPPIVHRNVILRVLVRRKRTLCQLLWHLFFLKDLVRDHHKLQQSDLKQIFHRVSVTNREGWIDVPRMLQNFHMFPNLTLGIIRTNKPIILNSPRILFFDSLDTSIRMLLDSL
jgi:hypothetical protein